MLIWMKVEWNFKKCQAKVEQNFNDWWMNVEWNLNESSMKIQWKCNKSWTKVVSQKFNQNSTKVPRGQLFLKTSRKESRKK